MNSYVLSSFFLIGSAAFFVMTYILKKKNRNTTFFAFITGILLLLFSIMGYLKYRNYIIITIIIVGYYLANAMNDRKHKKSKTGTKSNLQNQNVNKAKKNHK
jgi:hypothetical protein